MRKKVWKKCKSVSIGLIAVALLQIFLQATVAAPQKTRVLYLGDSMSMGAFGAKLDEEMREAGFDVYTFVAGGATPYYWLSRYSTIKGPIGYWEKTPLRERRQSVISAVPKVESLLERYDPDVVVVQTGTNLYAPLRSKRRTKENNVKEVEGLLNHMLEAATQGGRRCYWISPPEAHVGRYPAELQAELADLTKRVVSREARYFDSRRVTKYTDPYPKNDGIHYGATEAKEWATYVVQDFLQFMGGGGRVAEGMLASRTKRMTDMPSKKSGRLFSRALPLGKRAQRKLIPEQEEPPAKRPPVVVASARARPPVKQQPPEKKPSRRPPIQYVKKAIPIETKGIKWGELDIEVKLVTKSPLKSLRDIDYSYCFAVNEYEVVKVNSGYYPYQRIRIARVVMWSKALKPRVINESIGHRPRGGWELVPMSRYPRFERMQLVDELPIELNLPVYIIAFE
jgi:hypothetical protein